METCQSAWYNASNDPAAQAKLPCSPVSGNTSTPYMNGQCSKGYEDRLCGVCSPDYGVSG